MIFEGLLPECTDALLDAETHVCVFIEARQQWHV
jgi:hypothetical protein